MDKTYYQILGVATRAPFAELKRAYYRQAKRCHPDLFRNSPEKTREFQELVLAFDVLSDNEKRRRYDRTVLAEEELICRDRFRPEEPLMDSEADDVLEELVVGNNAPPETSLATLLADLQKTEVFLKFREGKELMRTRNFQAAEGCFLYTVEIAPGNIVFRISLARAMAARGKYGGAIHHYRAALRLGARRIPEQRLNRARRELENALRMRFPLLRWFDRLMHKETKPLFVEDPADRMAAQLSRSLTRAARTMHLENKKDQE